MSYLAFYKSEKSKKIAASTYKVIILLSAFSLLFFLYQMLQTAVIQTTPGSGFFVVMSHAVATEYLGWSTLLHIILIKVGARIKGGALHDLVFYIHLFFAILYTLLVTALFFFYSAFAMHYAGVTLLMCISYSVVIFLGVPMLLKRY